MTSDLDVDRRVEPIDAATGASQADTDPAAGPDPVPSRGKRRWWARVDLATAAQLVAVVPVLSMLAQVRSSSKTQWFDYWQLFPSSLNPDGSLAPRTLFSYHEGHVLAVPRLVYWLNYELTSGLNTTLGLFVIVVVLAQVWMLRRLLPDRSSIGPWAYTGVFVAGVALLFSPQGVHNYARAMSGTAWLLANLFAVAALLFASRARLEVGLAVAFPLAVLALLSYGTGLMTWPMLLVVALLRRPRWSVVHSVTSGVGVLAVAVYFLNYTKPASQSSPGLDLSDVGRRVSQVLGSVPTTNADSAVVVGVVGVIAAGFLVWQAVQVDREASAPWVGLVVYAVLGAGMIGMARGGVNGDDIGTSSRYFSLSALFLFGLLVLTAIGWPRDPRVLLAAGVVGGLAFVGGVISVNHVEKWNHGQDELAVAMRLGVSEGYPFFFGSYRQVPLLEDIGHYPFSDGYDADCGRTGEAVDATELDDLAGARGSVDGFIGSYNDLSVRLEGWVGIPDTTVDCVLVVDEQDVVVGAGAYGKERNDLVQAGGSPIGTYDVGFTAVAPTGSDEYRVVVQTSDGRLVEVEGDGLVVPEPMPAADGGLATEVGG